MRVVELKLGNGLLKRQITVSVLLCTSPLFWKCVYCLYREGVSLNFSHTVGSFILSKKPPSSILLIPACGICLFQTTDRPLGLLQPAADAHPCQTQSLWHPAPLRPAKYLSHQVYRYTKSFILFTNDGLVLDLDFFSFQNTLTHLHIHTIKIN